MNLRQKAKKYKQRCKELEKIIDPRKDYPHFDKRCVNMLPFRARIMKLLNCEIIDDEIIEKQIRNDLTYLITKRLKEEMPERIKITKENVPFGCEYETTIYIGFD